MIEEYLVTVKDLQSKNLICVTKPLSALTECFNYCRSYDVLFGEFFQ